jgi:hypothetical protein
MPWGPELLPESDAPFLQNLAKVELLEGTPESSAVPENSSDQRCGESLVRREFRSGIVSKGLREAIFKKFPT